MKKEKLQNQLSQKTPPPRGKEAGYERRRWTLLKCSRSNAQGLGGQHPTCSGCKESVSGDRWAPTLLGALTWCMGRGLEEKDQETGRN